MARRKMIDGRQVPGARYRIILSMQKKHGFFFWRWGAVLALIASALYFFLTHFQPRHVYRPADHQWE